jgi:hypothetical protein
VEAHVPGLEGMQAEIRGIEQRVDAMHSGLGSVRGTLGAHDTKLGVVSTTLDNIVDDIGELKGQMKWVLRGLWLAAATFTSFTVGLAVLIVSVLK